MQSSQIFILFNDDIFVLLIEDSNSLLTLTTEKVVYRLDRVLHLDYFITTEVDKVTVFCGVYLHSVASYLPLDLLAEMLVDPADVLCSEVPLKISKNDKIVNS